MRRSPTSLMVFACLMVTVAAADPPSPKGQMLVATELIQGDVFVKTVIVLLHHDSRGAMGFVVNRPTEVPVAEVIPDDDALSGYQGNIFWGGPVQMQSLRAMMKTDDPPKGAERVVGTVYLVPIDDLQTDALDEQSSLRLFLGYAGWAPGQLDRELELGSWIVVSATEERVFPPVPTRLWKELAPREEHRAAVSSR